MKMEKININKLKDCYNDRFEKILLPFVKLLLEKGYKIYSSADIDEFAYCHVQKGSNLIYIQKAYFSGVDISTQHKGNRNTGSGHRVYSGSLPTLEKVNHVLNTSYSGETYYNSIEEYLKTETVLKIYEVILK